MKFLSLDRFEGNTAILEDDSQKIHKINKKLLPINAREGDIFTLENKILKFDPKETKKRKEKSKQILKQILKND